MQIFAWLLLIFLGLGVGYLHRHFRIPATNVLTNIRSRRGFSRSINRNFNYRNLPLFSNYFTNPYTPEKVIDHERFKDPEIRRLIARHNRENIIVEDLIKPKEVLPPSQLYVPPFQPFNRWFLCYASIDSLSMLKLRLEAWLHHIQWARRSILLQELRKKVKYEESKYRHCTSNGNRVGIYITY